MTENGATYVPISNLNTSHGCFDRLQELREFYIKEFDVEPQFYVRVPGRLVDAINLTVSRISNTLFLTYFRVNIIGEHVDYCGYPVLPMAIEQSILLAVGYTKENSFLYLRNIDRKFDNYKCDLRSIR